MVARYVMTDDIIFPTTDPEAKELIAEAARDRGADVAVGVDDIR